MINNIIEIGAGDYSSCYSVRFLRNRIPITLFEPNILLYNDLVDKMPADVNIYNKAISTHSNGDLFYNYGYAGWIKGAKCFANTHMNHDGKIEDYEIWLKPLATTVPTLAANELSNIITLNTYLSINCNGAELWILESLKALPKIIRVCYYCHNSFQWSLANNITNWLTKNKYNGFIINKNEQSTYFEIEFVKE